MQAALYTWKLLCCGFWAGACCSPPSPPPAAASTIAGSLIRGLGPQLLGDLAGLPLVRAAFPQLHGEMQAALQHFAATQLHTGGWGGACWRGGGQLQGS